MSYFKHFLEVSDKRKMSEESDECALGEGREGRNALGGGRESRNVLGGGHRERKTLGVGFKKRKTPGGGLRLRYERESKERVREGNSTDEEIRVRYSRQGHTPTRQQGRRKRKHLSRSKAGRQRDTTSSDTEEELNSARSKRKTNSRRRHEAEDKRSRGHVVYSSTESDSEAPSPKRVRLSKGREEGQDSMFLDKFMTFLEKVKSSDKPKMTFNSNVIPEFDPLTKDQSILTWITKVEECAEIYGWEEREIIHYSLPKLVGVAKTWYQGLTSILHTWSEWKKKLIESFPCREDYAELLTEMLAKKAKYGESLEHYYYAKVNLLNRCKITGKQAVDCILYGVEDRAVKVGAQAAQFREPEQVLNYFKTVKSGPSRDHQEIMRRGRFGNNAIRSDSPKTGNTNPTIRCFNCNEVGHPSFKCEKSASSMKCHNCNEIGHRSYKCDKPLSKCTICNRVGHLTSNCYKNIGRSFNDIEKNSTPGSEPKQKLVSEIMTEDTGINKYIMDVKVNGSVISCHIDLGSQCSLIRIGDANTLNLSITSSSNLPTLRGIGASLVNPVGVVYATVEVQGISEMVNLYVVEDYVLMHPILLGHSFTEKPDILIIKTPDAIKFQRIPPNKISLLASYDIEIPSQTMRAVQVSTDSQLQDCQVQVTGTLRGSEGREYYLLPGLYDIKNGRGAVLIYNVSSSVLPITEGTLLTRSLGRNQIPAADDIKTSFSVAFNDSVMDASVNCNPKLEKDQRQALKNILNRYSTCFSNGLHDLGFTTCTEMTIELIDGEPIVYRPYRMSHAERLTVSNMVQEMLDSNIIRESSSPYASPIIMVQKKTGDKRLCVDYRALNRKTKKDHYPMPRVEDQLDLLAGNSLFTSLDLASGYYQIPLSEESRPKTAFVTPDGQYEFNRMPFGLVNAPSVFQRTINKILKEAKIKYAIVYMDDILIPSKDFDEGLSRLEEVLQLLREGGLTLKLSKCHFFLDTVDFLGFDVSANGIRPGSRKSEAVSKFPRPTNQHEVRQFLGLSGFFRRFIKGYAMITAPLTDLLRKNSGWYWNNEQEQAFEKVKELLTSRPVLALYDPKAEVELHTDACKEGLAGILLQRNSNGALQPVSYFSRKTTSDERKLHSYELETLAVIASLNRFRVYLIGIPFKILTDCNALRSTLVKRDLIPRISRWWIQLQEYDCTIEYRPGARMTHADALSRNPVSNPVSEQHVLDVLPIQESEQDWISTVQSADEEVKKIKEILSDPSVEEAMDVHKNYKLKHDKVYRIVGDELKWLVPRGVRWQILKMNHDDVGHWGFEKTLQRIKEHYWFAKMRRFVKKYVNSCLECAHHKAPGGKREGELHPIEKVCTPFHTIHADHLGPFVKSKKGNCYLLVIVDGFTKYISINPVKNTKSTTSVNVMKQYVSYFGVPTRLITDKGTSFTSKTFQSFIESYGIKHIQNAVATPRANGQVERFNRTILDALSTSNHGENDKSWDEHIPDIQVGINTTKHKTTQKTPSELLFGFNIISKTEGKLSEVINETLNQIPAEELNDLREEAGEKIKQQQVRDAANYNKHRKPATQYKEGDLVRVERQVPHDGKSQKLVVKYQGPYRIVRMLDNDRFLIEDTPLTRKHGRRYEAVVALDKIQPWMNFNRNFESESSENDTEKDE